MRSCNATDLQFFTKKFPYCRFLRLHHPDRILSASNWNCPLLCFWRLLIYGTNLTAGGCSLNLVGHSLISSDLIVLWMVCAHIIEAVKNLAVHISNCNSSNVFFKLPLLSHANAISRIAKNLISWGLKMFARVQLCCAKRARPIFIS